MNLKYPFRTVFMLLMAVLIGATQHPPRVSQAQGGGMLTYGSSTYGAITADTALVFYNFSGSAGDLVHINVLRLSGQFDPAVDLFAPDQRPLSSSERHGLAADTHDAHIALFLPQIGIYTLMISGANGSTGDFLLVINGRNPVSRTPLTHGRQVSVTIPQNAASQYFSFEASLCPMILTVLDPQPPTFPFIVKARDAQGQDVALLRGGDTLEDRVTVEASSGLYEVEVWSDDPALAGAITLLVACAGQGPACLSTDGTSGESAPGVTACPECPPCPDSLEEEPDICADFAVSTVNEEDGTITVNWTAVEGSDYTTLAVYDQTTGEFLFGQRVEAGIDTTNFDLAMWGLDPGPYTIEVAANASGVPEPLCVEAVTVEYEGEALPGECEIDILAPRETIANGLQTVFWTPVPGDVEEGVRYELWVYGEFDARVAAASVMAPATSLTLDLSEAAIGAGYAGENDFYLQINAFRGDERWCSNGVRVTRIR
jgi:hypothetical protein